GDAITAAGVDAGVRGAAASGRAVDGEAVDGDVVDARSNCQRRIDARAQDDGFRPAPPGAGVYAGPGAVQGQGLGDSHILGVGAVGHMNAGASGGQVDAVLDAARGDDEDQGGIAVDRAGDRLVDGVRLDAGGLDAGRERGGAVEGGG